MLKAVAARLEDEDSDVRQSAVDILRGQSALSDEMLKVVAARLEDEDSHVRKSAVYVLGGQSALSEEMLKAVAARLEHEDSDVRGSAVDVLQSRPALPENVFCELLREAYPRWLQESFSSHSFCRMSAASFYLATSDGSYEMLLQSCQQGDVGKAIDEVQQTWDGSRALWRCMTSR
jgi:vesicle coat complex subunit